MQIATDRTGNGLRLVVIVKAGKIAPARVAAQFDQACANHDPKSKPTEKPDNQNRWPALWKWPPIEQRAKKDRQEPSLKQLNLPAVSVPDLSDVNDRHVHRPKHREQNCICVAAENDERQRKANPRENC